MVTTTGTLRLARAEWREREAAHAERADALTAEHRARRRRGDSHPVEDFLYTYYSTPPSHLRRWHPGAGVELAGAEERLAWRWYVPGALAGAAVVDVAGFRTAKAAVLGAVERILRHTADRAPSFGCFGLHEWAMVYRQQERRHPVPLRLGQAGTDDVVDAHELRCTHFDAFRFFTAEAAPRNASRPSRETQAEHEQPGCLHAGMDIYKWAAKLGPLIPGELLLDAFELAREVRVLDMAASPYDLAAWGIEPVRIETPEGKAEYGRRQRAFAERSQAMRRRVLDVAF